MHLKSTLAVSIALIAGDAGADTKFETVAYQPTASLGFVYAQGIIDTISESDLRRLVFYAKRATGALEAVVDNSDSADISAQTKANDAFRSAIARLADAGARSGIPTDELADFFAQSVSENLGVEFIARLDQVGGGLDIETLLRNAANVWEQKNAAAEEGENFLNALAQASEGLTLSDSGGAQASAAGGPAAATQEVSGPVATANASAGERAIINRVEVVNGELQLVIQSGDRLSVIASAIYGDALSFNTIFQANQDRMRDPHLLEVGVRLRLPQP